MGEIASWWGGKGLGLQQSSVSLSQRPCWFSQPEVIGISFLSTGALGWGDWRGAWTPGSSGGTSAAEIFLLTSVCHTCVWDQPVSCLQDWMWLLVYILSCESCVQLMQEALDDGFSGV